MNNTTATNETTTTPSTLPAPTPAVRATGAQAAAEAAQQAAELASSDRAELYRLRNDARRQQFVEVPNCYVTFNVRVTGIDDCTRINRFFNARVSHALPHGLDPQQAEQLDKHISDINEQLLALKNAALRALNPDGDSTGRTRKIRFARDAHTPLTQCCDRSEQLLRDAAQAVDRACLSTLRTQADQENWGLQASQAHATLAQLLTP